MERATELLRDANSIAVVGVSRTPWKPSHWVTEYLISAGYDVHLVNPEERFLLGRPVYRSVQEIRLPIDIVDIFKRPEQVPEWVDDAIAAGAKAVWMQWGIVNDEAAAKARAAGLDVVMDRCTKIEHQRLLLLEQAGIHHQGI